MSTTIILNLIALKIGKIEVLLISITSIINTDLDPPFALTSDHHTVEAA